MAELTIRPEEIRDALEKFVAAYEPGTATREEIGVVTEAGDGIARIEGLPSTWTPQFPVTRNSMRRFFCRPSGVELVVMGRLWP